MSFVYFSFIEDLANNDIDPAVDTFYVMLCSASYTPSQSGHSKRDDITGEVTGTGYDAGGREITVGVSRTNGVLTISLGNVTWPAPVSGFTPDYAVIYKSRGGAASADELVCCLEDTDAAEANGNSYILTPSGNLTITVPTAA